jgi:YfiR/HmsC-like
VKQYKIIIALLIIGIWLPSFTFAQSENTEYEIKTAMMEKYSCFVEWPEETAIDDTTKPFIVTIIGKNPFGQILDSYYENRTIKDKKVIIILISSIDNIKDCHMLFICGSEKKILTKILEYTKDKPILTISDSQGFAHKGVHINMYNSGNKIRFEINQTAAKESGLYISYLLLNLAKIVEPEGSRK